MQNTNSRRKPLPTPHMEWKVCCTCRGILFISDDLSRAVLAKGEKKREIRLEVDQAPEMILYTLSWKILRYKKNIKIQMCQNCGGKKYKSDLEACMITFFQSQDFIQDSVILN